MNRQDPFPPAGTEAQIRFLDGDFRILRPAIVRALRRHRRADPARRAALLERRPAGGLFQPRGGAGAARAAGLTAPPLRRPTRRDECRRREMTRPGIGAGAISMQAWAQFYAAIAAASAALLGLLYRRRVDQRGRRARPRPVRVASTGGTGVPELPGRADGGAAVAVRRHQHGRLRLGDARRHRRLVGLGGHSLHSGRHREAASGGPGSSASVGISPRWSVSA